LTLLPDLTPEKVLRKKKEVVAGLIVNAGWRRRTGSTCRSLLMQRSLDHNRAPQDPLDHHQLGLSLEDNSCGGKGEKTKRGANEQKL